MYICHVRHSSVSLITSKTMSCFLCFRANFHVFHKYHTFLLVLYWTLNLTLRYSWRRTSNLEINLRKSQNRTKLCHCWFTLPYQGVITAWWTPWKQRSNAAHITSISHDGVNRHAHNCMRRQYITPVLIVKRVVLLVWYTSPASSGTSKAVMIKFRCH